MKRGQTAEVTIEKTEFPGKGIAADGDYRLTVKNALPGQKVLARVTKRHSGHGEAVILQVLEPSPLETRACDCPHFGLCGSCLYRTVPYEDQLKLKEQQVKDLLFPVAGEFPFEGVKGSPVEEGYRNKMEFSFGDEEKDGPLTLGMHKSGSFYDVMTTDECRIVNEDFRMTVKAVLAFMRERQVPYYHKNHVGYLRHLLVRRAAKTGELMICLVTSTQEPENWSDADFAACLKALPFQGVLTGILHIYNDSLADVVESDRTEILYGRDYFYEELLGLRFKITPFSFFQTNSLGAEVLYDTVRGYVKDAMVSEKDPENFTVFDLYSGTGTIAQLIAPGAGRVVGIEIVEEAVKAAAENAAFNGLSNCRFLAGDVLKAIDQVEEQPDLIILDPPRDGIHPKALPKILNYGVKYMVYISCKPTSLARDLVLIRAAGYEVVKGCSVDMFPDTTGIETVVLLKKTV